jgi:hypothetical protein
VTHLEVVLKASRLQSSSSKELREDEELLELPMPLCQAFSKASLAAESSTPD